MTRKPSKTQAAAIENFRAQDSEGNGHDLDCTGISRATLRNLRNRGIVTFKGLRFVNANNGRTMNSARSEQAVCTVVWNG